MLVVLASILDSFIAQVTTYSILSKLGSQYGVILVVIALLISTSPSIKLSRKQDKENRGEYSDIMAKAIELFFYGNVTKKIGRMGGILNYIFSIFTLISPPGIYLPEISFRQFILIETSDLIDFLKKLNESKKINAVGNISLTELQTIDWANLPSISNLQILPTKELLEKLAGGDSISYKFHFLDTNGDPAVLVIMSPIKGCIFKERLRRQKDLTRKGRESISVIREQFGPKPTKAYMITMLGLAEYVDYLKLKFLFYAPLAADINLMCDESFFDE